MRFHIGFSKRIKASTLLKLLGTLFIGSLAYFGLTQHAFAWTTIENPNFSSWDNTYYSNAHDGIDNIITTKYTSYYFFNNSNILFPACRANPSSIGDSCWDSANSIQLNSFFSAYGGSSPSYYKHITQEFTYILDNNNYCDGDNTNSIASIDFKFKFRFTGDNNTMFSSSNLSTFNQSQVDNLYEFRVIAVDSINELYFSSVCTKELDSSTNQILEFNVNCPNVFRGSSDYNIDKYYISILNGLPFNDLYNSSSNKNIAGNNGIYAYTDNSFCSGDYCKLQYQCNNDRPITDGELPSDDDPNGLNDIYDTIKDDYDSNLPGIDTSKFDILYPQNIQDLISLPLFIIDSIVEEGETCTPYQLDLSGLASLSGDNGTYKFTLPCMREKLSDLLGALYTLIDVLMASIVFYNIAMAIIQLLEAITSGVDLYSYYFTNTKEGLYILHSWGDR